MVTIPPLTTFDMVETESLEGPFEGGLGVGLPRVLDPQLGRDEQTRRGGCRWSA
jgi:hypothetical protein